ncbi:carbamoyltransferase HypF [Chitinilyticum litopenaei]|uniref:carbamoyltransferase HypF n=1 Tax=Chitinilyticum litopenaei TaxID=1121276 RepID=UPI0003FC982F|nr:carbamoyltransferase HypF [Chitinilyticum litopenaei]
MDRQRLRLTVRGIVQGVGFRPFVYRLAHELGVAGWVRNDGQGVTLEIDGDPACLQDFARRLQHEAPPLARIDACEMVMVAAGEPHWGFEILDSDAAAASVVSASIGADSAVCPACQSELFDPANRRYRYAFINCTDCGPRYTLVRHLPYDRASTSMAAFAQCAPCLMEYRNPLHRRFHAEPNACPDCGPALRLLDGEGGEIGGDAIAETLAMLQAGQIVAIKGLGGFHLVCDARNVDAVARLRERKHREEKPFAVMAANTASLAGIAVVHEHERNWLESAARPIVLLNKAPGAASWSSPSCRRRPASSCNADSSGALDTGLRRYDESAAGVKLRFVTQNRTQGFLKGIAPGLNEIGVLLPYTPIHFLLFHEAAGRPAGTDWLAEQQDLLLVMTSANARGEPLVTGNAEALAQLAGIADAFLMHDRDIVIRCDDSVLRVGYDDAAQFIRRARGYTPQAVPLALALPPVLALGGFFKNTLCVTRGRQAYLSQYIGDLDRVANCTALQDASTHLLHLLQVKPECIAHDKHPDFYSSQLALQLAGQWQIPCLAVQHHHAHIAAVLAEHQLDEPVLGLALDGVGLGDDGKAWGGELLLVDGSHYQRLGHLRTLPMPGGDKAAREPWRMAASVLVELGRGDEIAGRFAAQPAACLLNQLLRRPQPATSSLGRYFDAAAGLLGVAPVMSIEAQAAMQLEGLAARHGACAAEPGLYCITDGVLDLLPLLSVLADSRDPAHGAALFHSVLIDALVDWVAEAAERTGIRTVAGGGGCFLNAILLRGVRQKLLARGLRFYTNQLVPCGDGGLALGQAWVAQRSTR